MPDSAPLVQVRPPATHIQLPAMTPSFSIPLLLLTVAATLPAQTRTIAERLGYPAGTKLLILHADDLGVAHSADSASFAALERGAVSSASVMMTTPWITEVAAWAKAHPNADIGIHLTLTSEWSTYRWGSVAPSDKVPTLLDSAGFFPADVGPVVARASQVEVERELRAQIDRALALGIHPTHIDSHMGTLFATEPMITTYLKVARAYHLPFLGLRGDYPGMARAPLEETDVVPDAVVMAGPEVPRDQWKAFYLHALSTLKPGLTEMIVHLGYDDAELQAVTTGHPDYGSAWRQRDYDVVTSAEFQQALRDNGIKLVRWRDIGAIVGKP